MQITVHGHLIRVEKVDLPSSSWELTGIYSLLVVYKKTSDQHQEAHRLALYFLLTVYISRFQHSARPRSFLYSRETAILPEIRMLPDIRYTRYRRSATMRTTRREGMAYAGALCDTRGGIP